MLVSLRREVKLEVGVMMYDIVLRYDGRVMGNSVSVRAMACIRSRTMA